jgi:hypothetical protein
METGLTRIEFSRTTVDTTGFALPPIGLAREFSSPVSSRKTNLLCIRPETRLTAPTIIETGCHVVAITAGKVVSIDEMKSCRV